MWTASKRFGCRHSISSPRVAGRPPLLLFLERAAEIGAELDPADDGVIGEICRRLDGLPLAIELAAARTGVLVTRADPRTAR